MGPLKDVTIDSLNLDLANPRIPGGAKNFLGALAAIVDDQKARLLTLAKSIVAEGMSPIDRVLVMRDPESGELVVLEGNRRVAALKLLANPRLLDQISIPAGIKRGFTKLAESFKLESVEPIDCFEVEDRAAASSWIHLRHTGANGGKGVVDWSGLQASRFRGGDPALQALSLVTSYGGLTDEQRAQIEERFPITTLDRLLSSREVRQRLGFDVAKGRLLSGLPPTELIKPLRRMVLDLSEDVINVSALKNKTQQIAYVEGFDAASKPDLKKVGEVRPVDGIAGAEFVSNGKPPKRRKKPHSDPSQRKALVPKKCRLPISDNRIADIFKELCALKLDDAPNGIAVLFRVFLELSVDNYLETNKIPLKFKDPKGGRMIDLSLKDKVRLAVDRLVANGGTKKDYDGVSRALNDKDSPLHIGLLNNYVHNRFTTPTTRDLMTSWNNAQRFFEGLWP